MAKIGTMELLVFLIVAFFAIGPERMPKAAKALGRALGQLKKEMNSARDEILGRTNELKSIGDDLNGVKKSLQNAVTDAGQDMNEKEKQIQEKLSGTKKKKNSKTTSTVTPQDPERPAEPEDAPAIGAEQRSETSEETTT